MPHKLLNAHFVAVFHADVAVFHVAAVVVVAIHAAV